MQNNSMPPQPVSQKKIPTNPPKSANNNKRPEVQNQNQPPTSQKKIESKPMKNDSNVLKDKKA